MSEQLRAADVMRRTGDPARLNSVATPTIEALVAQSGETVASVRPSFVFGAVTVLGTGRF